VHRPADLPDYEVPPIDEVAIGVQLVSPIEGFVDPHAGLFWERVKDRYPKAETHPRVESMPQPFALNPNLPPPLSFPFSPNAGSRTFLISDDDAYLLQIQNNRFFRNWRRRQEQEYPHFDELASDFQADLLVFRSFLADEGLRERPIGLFEVTYINWIADLAMHEFLRPASNTDLDTDGIRPWPETQTWQAAYGCTNETGDTVARLNVQCASATRTTESGFEQGTQFAFTFSEPADPVIDEQSLPELLTSARRAIVRSFTQLTTEPAHERWRRLQ